HRHHPRPGRPGRRRPSVPPVPRPGPRSPVAGPADPGHRAGRPRGGQQRGSLLLALRRLGGVPERRVALARHRRQRRPRRLVPGQRRHPLSRQGRRGAPARAGQRPDAGLRQLVVDRGQGAPPPLAPAPEPLPVHGPPAPGRRGLSPAHAEDHMSLAGHPSFRWLERGDGEPVVLLHGLLGEMDHWETSLVELEDTCRAMALSLPIFDPAVPALSLPELTGYVERFLEILALPPAVVGGNSLGGHLALELALARPDRVSGLILTGSSGLFERGVSRGVPHHPTADYLEQKLAETFHDPGLVTPARVERVRAIATDRALVRRGAPPGPPPPRPHPAARRAPPRRRPPPPPGAGAPRSPPAGAPRGR